MLNKFMGQPTKSEKNEKEDKEIYLVVVLD